MKKRFLLLGVLLLVSGLLVMPISAQEGMDESNVAHAVLMNQAGEPIGDVVFEQFDDTVIVSVFAEGLEPGFHGFHIHQTGLCEPDADPPFSTAGGHFAPDGNSHPNHAGDMPALLVMQNGEAFMSFMTDRFTVADLMDEDGSAVIVHGGADNYANIPDRYAAPDEATLAAGDAGPRVACGVIAIGLGDMMDGDMKETTDG